MMLRREVPRFSQHIRWPLLAAVSGLVMVAAVAAVLGPRMIRMDGPSRQNIARMSVVRLADEWYPEWRAMQPTRICPPSIGAIAHGSDSIDPWGTRYRMQCGPHRFVAISAGEDQMFGTADDIRSDR